MSLHYCLPTMKISSRWPREHREYMLPMEQGTLLTMLDSIRPHRMIEFGVNEGRTASAVLKWIDSIEYYLGIDVPFGHKMPISGQQSEVPKEPAHMVNDVRFELMLRHTDGFDDSTIELRKPFDVAFIDGDHSREGMMKDYELSLKIMPPGSWIFWHDYNNKTVDVTEPLEDLHRSGHNIIHIEGTMLAYEQI